MTNPTRTRAEIQAEIEKLEQEMESAWPQEGDIVYLEAIVNRIDDDVDGIADVRIVGDGEVFQILTSALIPATDLAADLIPREEYERVIQQKDGAYSERNKLVAALSKMFPASIEQHDGADWEDDWRNVIYIDLPTRQVSWHIHDSELPLFSHLPRNCGRKWDGHSTEEKYERLASLEVNEYIPRKEHERAVAKANRPDKALAALVKAANDMPWIAGDIIEGQQYRVTVERVDCDPAEGNDHCGCPVHRKPADVEPIGWANLYTALGCATGYIYSTSESALKYSKPCHGDETAVPLYRHPAPVAPTAVAPVGVVGEIDRLYAAIQAAESYGWTNELRRIRARITELPMPSDWARNYAKSLLDINAFDARDLKGIAAALLAKEGDHD